MATLQSDLAAAQSQPNWRAALYTSDREKATVRYATVIYTCTGAEANNDVLQLLALPVGSVVLPDLCKISTDGVGGTGAAVASIGDAGSASRYSATSIAIVNAGTTSVTPANAIMVANPPYQIVSGNEIITATLALSSGNFTAGKLIVARVAYILP